MAVDGITLHGLPRRRLLTSDIHFWTRIYSHCTFLMETALKNVSTLMHLFERSSFRGRTIAENILFFSSSCFIVPSASFWFVRCAVVMENKPHWFVMSRPTCVCANLSSGNHGSYYDLVISYDPNPFSTYPISNSKCLSRLNKRWEWLTY